MCASFPKSKPGKQLPTHTAKKNYLCQHIISSIAVKNSQISQTACDRLKVGLIRTPQMTSPDYDMFFGFMHRISV